MKQNLTVVGLIVLMLAAFGVVGRNNFNDERLLRGTADDASETFLLTCKPLPLSRDEECGVRSVLASTRRSQVERVQLRCVVERGTPPTRGEDQG